MKTTILGGLMAVLAMAMWLSEVAGQTQKIKYGRPTTEELQMKEYAADSEADAVMLYEANRIGFEIVGGMPKLVYEREMRVKVLKKSGLRWAKLDIPYHESGEAKETFNELKACAVNVENGRTVKSEVSREPSDSTNRFSSTSGIVMREYIH